MERNGPVRHHVAIRPVFFPSLVARSGVGPCALKGKLWAGTRVCQSTTGLTGKWILSKGFATHSVLRPIHRCNRHINQLTATSKKFVMRNEFAMKMSTYC